MLLAVLRLFDRAKGVRHLGPGRRGDRVAGDVVVEAGDGVVNAS